MTWLISIIEAGISPVTFPFTYENKLKLYYSNLIRSELHTSHVPYESIYEVTDGKAYERLTMHFDTPEQVVHYLQVESRIVLAEQLTTLASSKPTRKVKLLDVDTVKGRIQAAYKETITNFLIRTRTTIDVT